jgi:hypothetical protein
MTETEMNAEMNVKENMEQKLGEIAKKLLKLQVIREKKGLSDLIDTLILLSRTGEWAGYIKIYTWSDTDVAVYLYTKNEIEVAKFIFKKDEPINKILQTVKEKKLELMTKILEKVAEELEYIQTKYIWQDVDYLRSELNRIDTLLNECYCDCDNP